VQHLADRQLLATPTGVPDLGMQWANPRRSEPGLPHVFPRRDRSLRPPLRAPVNSFGSTKLYQLLSLGGGRLPQLRDRVADREASHRGRSGPGHHWRWSQRRECPLYHRRCRAQSLPNIGTPPNVPPPLVKGLNCGISNFFSPSPKFRVRVWPTKAKRYAGVNAKEAHLLDAIEVR
jgi:hypothetical protein